MIPEKESLTTTIRLYADEKERLSKAAKSQRESLTNFLVKSAIMRAEKIERGVKDELPV